MEGGKRCHFCFHGYISASVLHLHFIPPFRSFTFFCVVAESKQNHFLTIPGEHRASTITLQRRGAVGKAVDEVRGDNWVVGNCISLSPPLCNHAYTVCTLMTLHYTKVAYKRLLKKGCLQKVTYRKLLTCQY